MKRSVSFFIAVFLMASVSLFALTSCESIVDKAKMNFREGHSANDVKISENAYWYGNLSEKGKVVYRSIYANILDFPERIAIQRLDAKEMDEVFQAISYDNPELFFLNNACSIIKVGYIYYFVPQYNLNKDIYESYMLALNKKADEITAQISSLSEYEKELYIHDYIAGNCVYLDDESSIKGTAYGAIVNGLANCEGYSRAAQLLLNKAGVYCRLIVGEASNGKSIEGHMWNVVRIDSNEYNLDITWDDYIIFDKEYIQYSPSYIYMNVPANDIKNTHTAAKEEYYKDCTSNDANYFNVSGLLFSMYDDAAKSKISSAIAQRADKGIDNVEFRFADKKAYDNAVQKLFKGQEIYRILSIADMETNKNIYKKEIRYTTTDNKLTIRIFFKF